MEKAVAVQLIRKIETRAVEHPFKLDFGIYKDTKYTSPFVRVALIESRYLAKNKEKIKWVLTNKGFRCSWKVRVTTKSATQKRAFDLRSRFSKLQCRNSDSKRWIPTFAISCRKSIKHKSPEEYRSTGRNISRKWKSILAGKSVLWVFNYILRRQVTKLQNKRSEQTTPTVSSRKLLKYERRVDREAEDEPITLSVIVGGVCVATAVESDPKKRKAQETFRRNQAMMAMIRDSVWCQELADIHKIVLSDVSFYYSKWLHLGLIVQVEFGKAFHDYVVSEAIVRYEIEDGKFQTYKMGTRGEFETGGFLRKIIAGGKFKRTEKLPRLAIELELYGKVEGKKTIEDLDDEKIALYNNRGGMSRAEFKQEKERIEDEIQGLFRRRKKLFDWMLMDSASGHNMNFIRAVGVWALQRLRADREDEGKEVETGGLFVFLEPETPFEVKDLKVVSVAHGVEMIKIYMRWFNATHAVAIAERRLEKKAQSDKKGKNRVRALAQQQKREKDESVLNLWKQGVTNKAEISRQTEVAVTTVKDIIRKYEQDLLSGESARIAQEQAQLEHEQQELARVREALYERERLKLEVSVERREKKRFEQLLIDLHNMGLNPTEMSKTLYLSASEISERLRAIKVVSLVSKNLGVQTEPFYITPNYDKNHSTPEEIELYLKEIDRKAKITQIVKWQLSG